MNPLDTTGQPTPSETVLGTANQPALPLTPDYELLRRIG